MTKKPQESIASKQYQHWDVIKERCDRRKTKNERTNTSMPKGIRDLEPSTDKEAATGAFPVSKSFFLPFHFAGAHKHSVRDDVINLQICNPRTRRARRKFLAMQQCRDSLEGNERQKCCLLGNWEASFVCVFHAVLVNYLFLNFYFGGKLRE